LSGALSDQRVHARLQRATSAFTRVFNAYGALRHVVLRLASKRRNKAIAPYGLRLPKNRAFGNSLAYAVTGGASLRTISKPGG
jgi:hypothetical protein